MNYTYPLALQIGICTRYRMNDARELTLQIGPCSYGGRMNYSRPHALQIGICCPN